MVVIPIGGGERHSVGDVVRWRPRERTREPCVCDAIGTGCEGDVVRTGGRVAELDDAALVRAVAADDVAALRCLYDRHVPWLAARLRGRCFDDALVADAVEDTFLAVWKSASRWRGEGDVAAWIWGIGVRQLVTHLRRAGRQARLDPFPIATSHASAEERVLEQVAFGDTGAALSRLSPELLEVVQAMVFDGLTARGGGSDAGPAGGDREGSDAQGEGGTA